MRKNVRLPSVKSVNGADAVEDGNEEEDTAQKNILLEEHNN